MHLPALIIGLLALSSIALNMIGTGSIKAAVRTLSYFTIQTNLIVGIMMLFNSIAPLLSIKSPVIDQINTAANLWILVTLIVFHSLLYSIYKPEGIRVITNYMLHYTVPISSLIFYFVYIPKVEFSIITYVWWLSYPFLFFIYSMLTGRCTGFYPYWFLKPEGKYPEGNVGYLRVFITAILLLLIITVLGTIMLGMRHLIVMIS